MAFSIATLARIAFGPSPEIICTKRIWQEGVAELHRRTCGHRESGAFLLGQKDKIPRIEEFVFYDDIDPSALATGIVILDGRKLGTLWSHCRKTGRQVIADVHVHPHGFRQSGSDKANPIIAEVGHTAIILPDFASPPAMPGKIGIHRYLGGRTWQDRSDDKHSLLHVGWWPWH